ncbi:BACON domain-containing protein [Niastella sp. OAS944]|uniref:BACON domain-containing protein n=1 Tax=Niastella sp. OAS944 TaxID=2664089 RepID=UPI00346D1759|nr:hypothetical protein [Chitinophagaceae bacterium OAS944]
MKRYLFSALTTLVIASSCQKEGSIDNPDGTTPTIPGNPSNPSTSTLTISRPAMEVGTIAGFVDTFTVQSGIDWAITLSAGAETWLKLDTLKGGSGATVVKLSVIADNTSATKTGTITISPVGSSTVTPKVITVNQQLYTMLWQKAFTAGTYSSIESVMVDTDGGYVFSGSCQVPGASLGKCWVFKTDANGNKVWETLANAMGFLFSITKTPDGGYIATGNRNVLNAQGAYIGSDLSVIKLNADGSIAWEKFFGGSGNKVLNTADGGYLIAGIAGQDILLFKLDASGQEVWKKTFGGSAYDGNGTLTTTADGGYLLAGYSSSNDGDISGGHGSADVVVFKLDASGNKIWTKLYGGSQSDGADDIIATKDGGSILIGSTKSNDGDANGLHGSDDDVWVLKLDNNGQKTWQATLGSGRWDEGYSITQLADGGYIALGFSNGSDGDVTGNHGDKDLWAVKLTNTGKKLWQRSFGGPGQELPGAVVSSADGSFVIAGYASADGGDVTGINGISKGWVVKCK